VINASKAYWEFTDIKGKCVAYLEAVTAEKEKQKLTPKQEEAKAA